MAKRVENFCDGRRVARLAKINEVRGLEQSPEKRQICGNSRPIETGAGYVFSNKTIALPSFALEMPSTFVKLRTNPLLHNPLIFENSYHVQHGLRQGIFGTVYAGARIRDGLLVSVKHVEKKSIIAWGNVCLLYNLIYYSLK